MAATRQVAQIAIGVVANTNEASKNIKNFRKDLAGMSQSGLALRRGMLAIATGIGAVSAATVVAIREFNRLAKEIDRINRTAQRLGFTFDQLAGLQDIAEQVGLSTQTLDMAMQRFSRRLAEAAQGTGEAKDAIAQLGFSAQQLSMMGRADQLLELQKAFARIGDEGERLRLAFKLFDSEGVRILDVLQEDLTGVAEATETLGVEGVRHLENYNKSMTKIGQTWIGIKRGLASGFAVEMGRTGKAFYEFFAGSSGAGAFTSEELLLAGLDRERLQNAFNAPTAVAAPDVSGALQQVAADANRRAPLSDDSDIRRGIAGFTNALARGRSALIDLSIRGRALQSTLFREGKPREQERAAATARTFNRVLERGSAEAFQAIRANRRRPDEPQKQTADNTKKMVAHQQEANNLLSLIAVGMQKFDDLTKLGR